MEHGKIKKILRKSQWKKVKVAREVERQNKKVEKKAKEVGREGGQKRGFTGRQEDQM